MGLERLLMVLESIGKLPENDENPEIFLANIGDNADMYVQKLVLDLRKDGISAERDYGARSLKAQMKYANKIGARFSAVVGDDDIAKGALNIKNMEMNMTSVVYAKNYDGEWEEYHRIHGEENRLWVGIDKMPKHLINAFIAIEDETFYDHSGINWKRTFGAIGNMLFKFDDTEFGGSTITQQLIKNVTGDKGHNATRKIREIVRQKILKLCFNLLIYISMLLAKTKNLSIA